MPARLITAFLGAWLLVSAFCWPHGAADRALTWIGGLVILGLSLGSMALPRLRLLTALAGLLLMVGTFLLYGNEGTLWNNLVVGLSVFIAATVPPLPTLPAPARSARA